MFTFAYTRVSTADQTTENQLQEIKGRGYSPDMIFSETVSGKVPAAARPEFIKLLDAIARMKAGKRLIVVKLDRLGRDAADVLATVKRLDALGCSVRVLQLGDLDLTTAAGKMVLTTLSAVAEMERDLLIERTRAGIDRARREGKHVGRPKALTPGKAERVREMLASGASVSAMAREMNVSRATVIRCREAI